MRRKSRNLHRALGALLLLNACSPENDAETGDNRDAGIDLFDAADEAFNRELFGALDASVDPYTGELLVLQRDVRIPGPAGLDLELNRTFRSQHEPTGASLAQGATHAAAFPYGGWSLHLGRALVDASICSRDARSFVFEDERGGRHKLFRSDVSGQPDYVSRDSYRGSCEDGTPTVFAPNGRRYTLGHDAIEGKYATRIEDVDGNWIAAEYSDHDVNLLLGIEGDSEEVDYVRLDGLSASDGRSIDLVYDGHSLRRVTVPDAVTGTVAAWNYEMSGHGVNQRLAAVVGPGGDTWEYETCVLEVFEGDESTSCFGEFSMRTPDGVLRSFALEDGVVKEKRESSDLVDFTWTFAYPASPHEKRTVVTGPDEILEYRYAGPSMLSSGAWQAGVLLEKTTSSRDGQVLESTTYDWGTRVISHQDFEAHIGSASQVDPDVHAPHLVQRTVVRDGTTYTTQFGEYDGYGNARLKSEWSSTGAGSMRAWTREFFVDTDLWIVNALAQESLGPQPKDIPVARTFDARGHVISETRFGETTTYAYDAHGDVVSTTAADGATTTYADYHRGTPQHTTHPDGTETSARVSDRGTIVRRRDEAGHETRIVHDGANRPISVDGPLPADITIHYGPGTQTVTATHDGASRSEFRRLHAGNVTRVERDGTEWSYTYDSAGRQTFASVARHPGDPMRGTTKTYDALGRVIAITNPDGSTRAFEYLPDERVREVDERGVATVRTYLAYGDPDERALTSIRVGSTLEVNIERDNLDRVRSVSQAAPGEHVANLRRQFAYDERGRVERRFDPERGWTTFVLDAVGRVIKETAEDGSIVLHDYDVRGREIATRYGGGQVERTYDVRGALTEVDSPDARVTFERDATGRVTEQSSTTIGASLAASFEYDGFGALSRVRYPSGRTVEYAPDERGLPTQALPSVSSVVRTASGAAQSITFSNDVREERTFDARFRLASLDVLAAGDPIRSLAYAYDGASNVLWKGDELTPETASAFSYDEAQRLVEAEQESSATRYAYDGRDNLLGVDVGGDARSFPVDASLRLTDASYDGRGNITAYGGTSYRWDGLDRIVGVENMDGTAEFRYDGDGRLVSRQSGDGTRVHYLIDPSGQLLGRYGAAGEVLEEVVWMDGYKVGLLRPTGDVFLHSDRLGTVELVTDEAGHVAQRWSYDAYGVPMVEGSGEPAIGFAGGLQEPEFDLVYLNARWYHPALGRFLSIDPVDWNTENVHSFNRYAYANNNPARFVDPTGNEAAENPYFAMTQALGGGGLQWAAVGVQFHLPKTVGSIASPPGSAGKSPWTDEVVAVGREVAKSAGKTILERFFEAATGVNRGNSAPNADAIMARSKVMIGSTRMNEELRDAIPRDLANALEAQVTGASGGGGFDPLSRDANPKNKRDYLVLE